jgi:hypothetical protein
MDAIPVIDVVLSYTLEVYGYNQIPSAIFIVLFFTAQISMTINLIVVLLMLALLRYSKWA